MDPFRRVFSTNSRRQTRRRQVAAARSFMEQSRLFVPLMALFVHRNIRTRHRDVEMHRSRLCYPFQCLFRPVFVMVNQGWAFRLSSTAATINQPVLMMITFRARNRNFPVIIRGTSRYFVLFSDRTTGSRSFHALTIKFQ